MTSASDAIISLKNVSKHFGPVKAVDDVSFDIMRGEFFSMLGPSGCGKTTLLRMLAGFEVPTTGEIFIDGQPMANVPPNERPTNMVFQNYAIFPHLTVRENIAYGLRKSGLNKDQLSKVTEDALGMIKLPGYGDRMPHQLSGGQRQRVALGPGAGLPAEGAAAGRTAGRSGQETARGDADRAARLAAVGRHHLHLRHPRSGGGADAIRPHCRHVPRQAAADRQRHAPVRESELPRGGGVHRLDEFLRWRPEAVAERSRAGGCRSAGSIGGGARAGRILHQYAGDRRRAAGEGADPVGPAA